MPRDSVEPEQVQVYIIVDVGCIECGEQTEVVGVYDTAEETEAAFTAAAKARNIEEWEPRGGFLEMLGLYKHDETTYVNGCGYFTGGQHALEIHRLPPRELKQ